MNPEESGLERQVRVFPGRALTCSPDWAVEGAAVAFDRNSGDYWVVSPLARNIIELVTRRNQESCGDIVRKFVSEATDDGLETSSASNVISVIRELVQREILIDA